MPRNVVAKPSARNRVRYRQRDEDFCARRRADHRAYDERRQRPAHHVAPHEERAAHAGAELHHGVERNQYRRRQHRCHDSQQQQSAGCSGRDAQKGGEKGCGRQAKENERRDIGHS